MARRLGPAGRKAGQGTGDASGPHRALCRCPACPGTPGTPAQSWPDCPYPGPGQGPLGRVLNWASAGPQVLPADTLTLPAQGREHRAVGAAWGRPPQGTGKARMGGRIPGRGGGQPGSGMPLPPGPQSRADRLQQVATNSCGRSVPVQLSTRQAPSATHLPARGSPWPLRTRGSPVSGGHRAPGPGVREAGAPTLCTGQLPGQAQQGPSPPAASPGAPASRQG